ncbi:hypothetical protein NHQ30_006537 [Ciborinia camelliae]|nr:hypothetical protein NHQ30_006537 [Ciborinia camelliae]
MGAMPSPNHWMAINANLYTEQCPNPTLQPDDFDCCFQGIPESNFVPSLSLDPVNTYWSFSAPSYCYENATSTSKRDFNAYSEYISYQLSLEGGIGHQLKRRYEFNSIEKRSETPNQDPLLMTATKLLSQASFTESMHCSWPECTSRALFSNHRALEAHFKNIHVRPLVCDAEGCGYQKPFRNKHDMERHKQTAHQRGKCFACPFPRCLDKALAFIRNDKLLVHFRDAHSNTSPNDICPFPHCGKPLPPHDNDKERMPEHMKKEHGNYECALGSCGKQQSRFTDKNIICHLKIWHGIESAEASRVVSVAKKTSGKTVRSDSLPMVIRPGN